MRSTGMKSSASAEKIGGIVDLLTEILLRIPAKHLLKCKCVSKQWLSLISDPKFCFFHSRHQRNLSPTPGALLLNDGYSSSPAFQVVPLQNHAATAKIPSLDYLGVPRVKILQSCNGLLLCSSTFLLNEPTSKEMAYVTALMDYFDYSSSVVTYDDRGFRFFVCNPTTKQFKFLHHPTQKQFNDFKCFLGLAFDPLKSPHYEVVYIQFVGRFKNRYQIHIYSSEADSWSLLPNTFEVQYGITGGGVFCNSAIHWYSHEQSSLYFDFDSGCLRKMPMPSEFARYCRTRDVLYFGESQGNLYMVVTNDHSTLEFDVLQMVPDYSEWFVRYHVDLRSIRTEFAELIWDREDGSCAFSVLSLFGADKEEELIVVLLVDGTVMSYNLCDGTPHILCDLKSRPGISGVSGSDLDYEGEHAYQYFESLICVSPWQQLHSY